MTSRKPTTRGFRRTSSLLQKSIRSVSETRGFTQSRLLTQWVEIVGQDIATIARPIKVSHARHGLGATLTVLTTGAQAPMLEMQKEKLRERVNTCYGHTAISRIRITQTAATGFAEGQAQFTHKTKDKPAPISPEAKQAARTAAKPIADQGLRDALEALGENIISGSKHAKH
jgi:hypothetical protein